MKKILDNLLEIIANSVDAYTVCFFLKEKNKLKLLSFFSLSQNIKKDAEIKIEESFIGIISKYKKPVNLKGDDTDYKFKEIYKKNEEIKSYFILPVGNRGIIYVDSKRMYFFTEKHQKNLSYFAKFLNNFLNLENEFKKLEILNILKNFDRENFLDFLCSKFSFEYGIVIKREGENFRVILTNYTRRKIPEVIDTKNSKIGIILKKNLRKIICFKDNGNNFFIIPFFKSGIIISAIVLFNYPESLEKDLEEKFRLIYPFLDVLTYSIILKHELSKETKVQRDTDFITIGFFVKEMVKSNQKWGFIVFRIKNFIKILKKYEQDKILYSYRRIKSLVEKIIGDEVLGVIGSLNTFFFVVDSIKMDNFKKFIEKNLKKTYLKIENQEESVIFEIKFFKRKDNLLKFIFSSE